MKKFLTFFLTALLTFSVGWAATVTFNSSNDHGSTQDQSADSMSKDGITISSTTAGLGYSPYRFYSGGTTTISSTVGNITSVVFTCSTGSYSNALYSSTFNPGYVTQNDVTVTWTGNAASFTIKASAQFRVVKIVVTTAEGSTVTAPTITPDGGDILASQQISMSAEDGASIYYTINGNNPTTSSTLYTAPFTLNSGATVKAIAVKDGVSSTVTLSEWTKRMDS